MRLDKLIIGSAKDSPAHQFKNLKNVTIDFDQDHWVTVVIGWNGTGKSNVLEALAIIFRDLIALKRMPPFAFKIRYRTGSREDYRHIFIDSDPDRRADPLQFYSGSEAEIDEVIKTPQDDLWGYVLEEQDRPQKLRKCRVHLSEFLKEDSKYLPRYVFAYYSGESDRMHEVFRPYLEKYDKRLRNGEDPGIKRLFYAMPVHSQFVLLAFLIQQSDVVRDFLKDHLGLDPDEGMESVLFVLRQPPWKSNAADGDPRFWNARGVVRDFLSRLYDIALAPIEVSRRVPVSIWNEKTIQFKYLYVKDIAALRQLVGNQMPREFFRDLESTYVSELIEEVRIRVRLKKNDGSVTFRELSEGEQQLLTVLGLLRFTAEEESLFLLDEPDTHLNPRWSVEYITYLKKFIGIGTKQEEASHILLTTHNPLAIAELDREQVQILRMHKQDGHRQIVACFPEMAPRGMGYAAIVTSDMFGIASSLDHPTQELLEAQRVLAAKDKLTADEQRELDGINAQLDRLGFRFFHPDDEYSRYLRLRNELLVQQFKTEQPKELAKNLVQMSRAEREQLAKQLIAELLADEAKSSQEEAP
ncbi:AAA family ATPase [Cupriavidus sp. H18C2]|uniref:AAA family ATPase n=1 Tax=Cupriavidus sp. H18C2 TaxID=3241602 RepID=UPI003BF7B9C0